MPSLDLDEIMIGDGPVVPLSISSCLLSLARAKSGGTFQKQQPELEAQETYMSMPGGDKAFGCSRDGPRM